METTFDLSQLRNLVRQYIDNHLYDTALFWADKVCTLSGNELQDVIWLSNAMYHTKQYRRAIHLLKSKDISKDNLEVIYMIARCYTALKEWSEVLDTAECLNQRSKICTTVTSDGDGSLTNKSDLTSNRKVESGLYFLRGQAYESQGVQYRDLAVEAYKEALMLDVYCFEAFDALVSHYMLTSQEEVDLVNSLPFKEQCTQTEADVVKFVFSNSIKKYNKPVDIKVPSPYQRLSDNYDITVSRAEKYFNNFDYNTCFEMTSSIMRNCPFHEKCIPLYIACLFELKKKILLFDLSQRLVQNYPDRAISWYGVGSYYLLLGRNESARRYFSKATTINHIFAPAWLGFAHSYANEGEHDQAISAYFTASRLMPGSHLPFLYLGLEYVVTHNIRLAKKFFREALIISPDDPHVMHELGTVAYHSGKYKIAERHFKDAYKKVVSCCGPCIPEMWEPLLNNLGHVYRKLGDYKTALLYHKKALQTNPQQTSTLASIGLVFCYINDFSSAVSAFHRSLSSRRDETLSSALLNIALEEDAATGTFPTENEQEVLGKTSDEIDEAMEESTVLESDNVSMDLEESFGS